MVQVTENDIALTLKYGLGGVTTKQEAREYALNDARDCNKDIKETENNG